MAGRIGRPDFGLHVTDAIFVAVPPTMDSPGLLGWVTCTLNGALILDSLALRRSRDGGVYIAFPFRVDRQGERHFTIQPTTDAARIEIERQILAALAGQVEVTTVPARAEPAPRVLSEPAP